MKIPAFVPIAVFIALGLMACQRGDPAPQPDAPLSVVHYDGENRTAPNLPGSTYEAAIRLGPEELAPVQGGTLAAVYYFFRELPETATVKVYKGTVDNAPENEVYSAIVSGDLQENSWHTHELSNPVALDGEDIWISVRFAHADARRSIGCDPGPAVTDGEWLYDSLDGLWRTFQQRSPGANINWNIRAVVSP
ncbi:MAG: hypothetical protein D6722_27520 [Bacteroidetes bacterium]|nr:MAG: hypothetical protein D6722_27520 [Bacteroidota bacterium]